MEVKKVLVLGSSGMLGHMVVKYLSQRCNCISTTERFPSTQFKELVSGFDGDYIINCIGAIPQKTSQFDINYELPIWLDKNAKCKVIHPGTDCEMDKDAYGISKTRASDYIKQNSQRTKIIKTSIIGPELNSSKSLLCWFLNSTGEVRGYKNAMWSGITTLEWAKICWNLICNWEYFDIENVVQGTCLSKYELLCIIKEVYNKDINILLYENEYINKCLVGKITTKHIKDQLEELKKYE